MSLDSAITPHLRCPRTRTRRVSDTWAPTVPNWSAVVPESITQVVMAYYGVQSKGESENGRACAAFQTILKQFKLADGPARHDLVQFIDGQGHLNLIAVAYWDDPAKFHKWNDGGEIKNWWASDDRLNEGVGYFREIFSPRMEQFETVFFGREPIEGVSVLLGGLTDNPIIEHGYWGSMRDRMPLSQTDTIDPSGKLTIKQGSPEKGGRVIVAGHQNLTLIRSGEDWSKTVGEERRTWFDDIQPVLHEGMNFLRDDGLEVGCYVNRYCFHVDENGKPEERGFGVSLWHSMQNLESWAESHYSHLQIFVTFHRLAKKFSNLTLYHEVSVFDSNAQYFEYINCDPKTGVMRAL
jgi:aldoxime dehydratase